MTGPKLVVFPEQDTPAYEVGRPPETMQERVLRLQREARLLAREEIESFARRLGEVVEQAEGLGRGGEAYPAGVRDFAERTAADLRGRLQTLQALMERTAP